MEEKALLLVMMRKIEELQSVAAFMTASFPPIRYTYDFRPKESYFNNPGYRADRIGMLCFGVEFGGFHIDEHTIYPHADPYDAGRTILVMQSDGNIYVYVCDSWIVSGFIRICSRIKSRYIAVLEISENFSYENGHKRKAEYLVEYPGISKTKVDEILLQAAKDFGWQIQKE